MWMIKGMIKDSTDKHAKKGKQKPPQILLFFYSKIPISTMSYKQERNLGTKTPIQTRKYSTRLQPIK